MENKVQPNRNQMTFCVDRRTEKAWYNQAHEIIILQDQRRDAKRTKATCSYKVSQQNVINSVEN